MSGPDRKVESHLAGDSRSSQLPPGHYYYHNRADTFDAWQTSRATTPYYWGWVLRAPPVRTDEGRPSADAAPTAATDTATDRGLKVRHLWGLRKKVWWKYVGIAWAFCTILTPAAAYAMGMHR